MNLVKNLWLMFDKFLVAWFAQIVMFVFLMFEKGRTLAADMWWLGPWTDVYSPYDDYEARVRLESWSQDFALFLVLTVPGLVSYLIYNNIKKVSPELFELSASEKASMDAAERNLTPLQVFHKERRASEKAAMDAALVVIEDNKDLAPFKEKLQSAMKNQTWTGTEIAEAFGTAIGGTVIVKIAAEIFGFSLK